MKKVVVMIMVIIVAVALVAATIVEVSADDYEPELLSKVKIIAEGIEGLRTESNEEEIETYDFRFETSIGSVTFIEG